ncbi:MAG TPA: hypothetical protein VG826_15880 [Pirellulales bacterium]|nr:hypothetical protein [Pirellulales bacterium]
MRDMKHKAPATPRHEARTVPPGRRVGLADFDEQAWPVNLLLLLFAACVGGIIVAKSDFAAPRLIVNGWCHLGALAVIVTALAWGIVRFEGRVQHRMQIGVFLSLLVHLWLCMLSYNLHLSALAQREKDSAELVDEPEPVTLPDYNWQNEAMDDAVDPTLDRPVETSTPDREDEIERTEPVEEPKERPAEQEPQVPPQPSVTPLERAESSAPHRGELAGPNLSRQKLRLAETGEQAVLPPVAEPEAVEHGSLDSAVRVVRVETETLPDRAESETRLPTSAPTAASMVRRPNEEQTPARGSAAQARRQTEADLASRIRVENDRVAETPDSATPLTPRTGEVERADTHVTLARRNRPVTESQSLAVEPSPRRAEPRPSQPRVDPRADARLARSIQPPTTAQPTVGAPQPRPQSQPSRFAETPVESMERAEPSLPEGSARATNSGREFAEHSRANVRAASVEAGGRLNSEPTLTSEASAASPRRLATAAARDVSLAESSPATSAVPSAQPMTQPSTAALSKASGGATGLTRQQNFDSELPGSSRNAVSRSAARRADATQTLDAGPAGAPSDTARIAKARAGAEVPSVSLAAEDVAMADVAGSRRPAETQASASAAVERVAAAAPRSRVTAAAGSGMIDQGAPQIRSPIGEGRTSGGGEPSLSRAELQAKLVRETGPADVRGGVAGTDGPVAAQSQISAGAQSGASGEQTASAPSSTAVGRAASTLPERTAEAANTADGLLGQAVAGEVTRQAAESLPQVAGQFSASGRPRAAPVGAALDAVDGSAEAVTPSTATFSSTGPSEPGDGEPASASDLGHESSAGHLVRGGESGEMGASPRASLQAGLARRAGEESAVAIGHASGASPGKSAGPAAIGEASVVADAAEIGSSPSDRGMDAARPADLSGVRQSAALPVLAAAPLGAGGLDSEPAFDVGMPSRLARPESDVAHLDSGRLILERSGANRAAEVRVQDVAVPGFRQRDRQLRQELARQRGGNEASERAVEMGLDFLARHQNVDGSWSLQLQKLSQGRPGYENAGDGQMVSDTAATGLAMLAFLGAGYTHTDGKYRLAVGRGLNYLLGNQRPDGDLFLPQEARSNLNVWLYSHGIASIALCEAYGMTRDPNLRQPAQRALDFIAASQHPTDGGWRYSPRQGSDTSVSGWQIMALKSGELAGLQVPAPTYAKVTHWLDGAQAKSNQAYYVYRPKATREHQRTASRVMTAEALLMRQYLGWKRDNRLMTAGADYLLNNLPEWTSDLRRQRDSYYWYYATQVMFQMGGPHWDAWNEQLRPLLVEKQISEGPLAGSWEPMGDVPDRWGREGGRIYVTAMHLLMLEVYYRHLPLYRTLEGE